MIKLTEILSKPVISLIDSKTEGIIKNAYFDKNFKRLKFFVLFDNNEHMEEKALNINSIYSFGESAVIIKDGQDLILEASNQQVDYKKLPINNSVYTYLGKFEGKVTDLVLDDKYYIYSLLVGQKEININDIISCGEDAVIIQDNNHKVNTNCIKRKKQKNIKILDKNNTYKQNVVILNKNKQTEIPEQKNDQFLEKIETIEQPINSLNDNEISIAPITETLLQKPKYVISSSPTMPKTILANSNFLLGRKLEKNIYSQNKELIARKNTKITQEIINKAKMYYKLRELTKFSR